MIEENDIAITVKDVSKTFTVGINHGNYLISTFKNLVKREHKKIKALKNVSFEIKKGECFGLVGRNGCGKSTLTKLMSGALLPDKGGEVQRFGTSMLLNLGVGFSHELTARENIRVNGVALGLRLAKVKELEQGILEFAEIEEFADTKIKHFSTGMIQRLSFSVAVNASADIIFLDEVFAVGDASFRKKAVAVMEKSWVEGRTVIMVSHNLDNISKYCHRALVLEKGNPLFLGTGKEAVAYYLENLNL